jgi:hypothetical protein
MRRNQRCTFAYTYTYTELESGENVTVSFKRFTLTASTVSGIILLPEEEKQNTPPL